MSRAKAAPALSSVMTKDSKMVTFADEDPMQPDAERQMDASKVDRHDQSMSNLVHVYGTEAIVLLWFVSGLLLLSLLTTGTSILLVFKLRLLPSLSSISSPNEGLNLVGHNVAVNSLNLAENTINVPAIDGSVVMKVGASQLSVTGEGIEIIATMGLSVVSSKTGQRIFPPDFASAPLPASLSSFTIESGGKNVKKIRSPIDQDLEVRSQDFVRIGGSQGLKVQGRTVSLEGHSIDLSSINGTIGLHGAAGIFMPAISQSQMVAGQTMAQYKMCICSRSGRVFRLRQRGDRTTCADVRFPESVNPCL